MVSLVKMSFQERPKYGGWSPSRPRVFPWGHVEVLFSFLSEGGKVLTDGDFFDFVLRLDERSPNDEASADSSPRANGSTSPLMKNSFTEASVCPMFVSALCCGNRNGLLSG